MTISRISIVAPTLVLAALVLAAGSALAGSFNCDYCGKALSGKYIEYDRHRYHPDCYADHIAPRCGVCGDVLDGEWVVYDGKAYHEKCYNERVALRCSHCGETVEGTYLYDSWGNVYHPRHEKELGACQFCGRLLSAGVTGGGRRFESDRFICSDCDREAISDENTGRPIMADVRDRLETFGIEIDRENVEFELVTSDRLAELTNGSRANHFGLTLYREEATLFGLLQERRFTVYILKGLPRSHFIATAAHELMHVWQFANAPQFGNDALCEGSCNYASLLVLKQIDNDMARYVRRRLKDDPDKIYGEGFRRVKKLVDNRGIEFWLHHLRFDPEFPVGY